MESNGAAGSTIRPPFVRLAVERSGDPESFTRTHFRFRAFNLAMVVSPPAWHPYCGVAPVPAAWWESWNFDPVLFAAIAIAGIVWWRRAGHLRAARKPAAAALAVVLLLFVTPFCALSSALFTARVVHHVLLATLLAPLLVAAFDMRRVPGSLAGWTAIQALVFWAWHLPAAYSAALSSDAVFWAMQISITLSAALWWTRVLRAEAGAAVLSLLATMVQMGLLGAILTFAGRAYYAPHWLTTQPWGLSPMEDQQIAGIIMWAPASAIYLLCALTILYRSFAAEPAR